MSARFLMGVGLGALVVPAIAWAQGEAGDASRNWAAIEQCGEIKNADRRHECMDGVLQRAGVLSNQQVAQEAREEFGREDRPAPRPAEVERPRVADANVSPVRAAELDEVVSTVKSVRNVGYHRIRVTTAEGTVWDQTQAETFTAEPKPGDRFAVERASMGSFLCKFGRSSSYRCERAD